MKSEKSVDTRLLTCMLFSITALIYLTNVSYEYFYVQPETPETIYMNLGLAIMFFIIGLSSYLGPKQQ